MEQFAVVSTTQEGGGSLQALTPCYLGVEEWEAEGGVLTASP